MVREAPRVNRIRTGTGSERICASDSPVSSSISPLSAGPSAFTAAMGLDFGGLDILRDRADGRIYIVDANKTDMGPPSALASNDKLKAMRGLADAFAALVDERLKA